MQTNGFWCKQEIERSDLWGNDKCNSGGIKKNKRATRPRKEKGENLCVKILRVRGTEDQD